MHFQINNKYFITHKNSPVLNVVVYLHILLNLFKEKINLSIEKYFLPPQRGIGFLK